MTGATAVDAFTLLNRGELSAAIEAAGRELATAPLDPGRRLVLAQLVCLERNWTRAEVVIRQTRALDREKEHAALLSLLEALVRAEQEREDFWAGRGLPSFLTEPGAEEKDCLWRVECFRGGKWAELDQANSDSKPANLIATWQNQQFAGLRDVDDLTATVLEAHTPGGKYLWIPFRLIKNISLRPPVRPLDILWAPARLTLRAGLEELYCFLPAIYFPSQTSAAEKIRLGFDSEFDEQSGGNVLIGRGRRLFDLGDQQEVDIFSLGELAIATPGEE